MVWGLHKNLMPLALRSEGTISDALGLSVYHKVRWFKCRSPPDYTML